MSDVVSWAGLFFLGSAVVDGGRGSSGGVHTATAIIQFTVHTSRVRLDDEISTSAAH